MMVLMGLLSLEEIYVFISIKCTGMLEVIYEMFLLYYTNLCINYVYDSCSTIFMMMFKLGKLHDIKWNIFFHVFLHDYGTLFIFVLTPTVLTFSPSIGSGCRGDHFSGECLALYMILVCWWVLVVEDTFL